MRGSAPGGLGVVLGGLGHAVGGHSHDDGIRVSARPGARIGTCVRPALRRIRR